MTNLPALIETELIPLTIADEIDALCAGMDALVISDIETYEKAAKARKGCKDMAKRLDGERKRHTAPLDDRKAEIMAIFRRPADRLAQTEKALGGRMVAYDQEQQRLRDEEARRVNEVLRQRAEDERKKAEAEALQALRQGRDRVAEAILDHAETIKAPEIVAAEVKPVAAGVHYREVWKFEVTDFAALPDAYKLPNDVLLGQIARARHDAAAIPGVRFFAEKVLAQR